MRREYLASASLVFAVIMLLSLPARSAPAKVYWEFWDQSVESSLVSVDHDPWQRFLDIYLTMHSDGVTRLRYGEVSQSDHQYLRSYLDSLAKMDPRRFGREEQFAYWVNLYNALTVNLILEHYPVASIRKTGEGLFSFGPWNDPVTSIAGQVLTLNDIEHRILRPLWQDPRIHYVLNCASIGCPNLLPTVFSASEVERLLTESARDFIRHPRALSQTQRRLTLSSIYDWYEEDFGGKEGVIEHLSYYLPEEGAARLRGYRGRIRYEYDWQLNDSASGSP